MCANAHSRLACIAIGITGQRDIAEDILQQAIAIAIEKNSTFESQEKFLAWLAGIVKNCALNHRRKVYRRKTHATDPNNLSMVESHDLVETPVNPTTGQLVPLQNSFDDDVNKALQRLTPEARSCLLLRTVEQLSYREISSLMSIPEGTAMSLVHRSKQTLRETLKPKTPFTHGNSKPGADDE